MAIALTARRSTRPGQGRRPAGSAVDALEDAIRAPLLAVAVLLLPRRKFCSLPDRYLSQPDRYLRYQIVPAAGCRRREGGMSGHAPRSSNSGTPAHGIESCAAGCCRTKALLFRVAALEGTLHGRATATQMTRIQHELRVGAEYPYRANTAVCVAIAYHDGNDPIWKLPAWFTRRDGVAGACPCLR